MDGMHSLLTILEAFKRGPDCLSLDDIEKRTGLSQTIIKPIIDLLQSRNLIESNNEKYSLSLQNILKPDLIPDKNKKKQIHNETHLEASTLSFAVADNAGKLVNVDNNFVSLWGYESRQEVIGRPAVDFWKDPTEAEKVIDLLEKQNVWAGELEALLKDRKTEMLFVSAVKCPCVNCKSSNIIASFTKKNGRETKIAFNDRIINTSEIMHKHTLHDLNNHMFIIDAYLDALTNVCREDNQLKYLEDIKSTCARSVNCIRNSMHDLHEEKRIITFSDIAYEQTIRSICGKGIKYKLSIEPNTPSIIGRRSDLLQLLSNLLINAVQSMDKDGTLTISANKRTFREPQNNLKAGNYCCISVSDTGKGIPKEELDKIFELHYTTKQDGSGFGLPRCKEIVCDHNGFMQVHSEVNVGTIFKIYLPGID